MTAQLRTVGAILLSILFFVMGNGLLNTLIPVRGDMAGFSNLAIGIIGSAYYGGFVLGCFAGPRLLARAGHIRAFAVGSGLAAATVMLQPIFVNEAVWALARLVFGFAAACIYMVVESWLNDRASNETRGRILALYMSVNFSGLVFGQWLYTAALPSSFVLFNASAMFYALCLMPVSLTRLPQPQPGPVPSLRPWRLFAIAPVGVAGCAAVGFVNGAVWTLAPVYAHGHGLTNVLLATFMSAFTAAGALVQVPAGRLSDRMDRRYVIAGMSFLAGIAGLALALFGGLDRTAAIVLFAVYGAMSLPIYGLSVAHANDHIPREEFVETSATLLLVNALSAVAGPTVAAAAMAHSETAALFFFAAAVHIVHVLFVLWRMRVAEKPSDEFKEPYAPFINQATPAALELDPRGPETSDPAPV